MTVQDRWFPVVASGILVLLLAAVVFVMTEGPHRAEVGRQAPVIAGVDRDGVAWDTQYLEGKVVLLNLWATWCLPCRREMPSMQRLYEELEDAPFEIVAVSVDGGWDDGQVRERIWKFADDRGLSFTVLHDPTNTMRRRYGTGGLPESLLIGADGVVRKRVVGEREWDAPEWRDAVEALLDEVATGIR